MLVYTVFLSLVAFFCSHDSIFCAQCSIEYYVVGFLFTQILFSISHPDPHLFYDFVSCLRLRIQVVTQQPKKYDKISFICTQYCFFLWFLLKNPPFAVCTYRKLWYKIRNLHERRRIRITAKIPEMNRAMSSCTVYVQVNFQPPRQVVQVLFKFPSGWKVLFRSFRTDRKNTW